MRVCIKENNIKLKRELKIEEKKIMGKDDYVYGGSKLEWWLSCDYGIYVLKLEYGVYK